MTLVGTQTGANRVVTGTKVPTPCGDPRLSAQADGAMRREIVKTALKALQTEVPGPTVFIPNIKFTP